ncbi:MAG: type IV fimbrial biogenesis protein FimT [Enterobacterales bacterium]|jgi:type IV fimbrial biogenesis protein FimT
MKMLLKALRPRGVTLIELLIVVALFSITMMIAAPSFTRFTSKSRITTNLNTLARAISIARESAVTMNAVITLCRSDNQNLCRGSWHDGMILFVDYNKDHIVNGKDYFIAKFDKFPKDDIIFWRAFQNRQYLQMSPQGFTRFQNGTFTYCPKEGLEYSRGIILNAQGRVRFTKDEDGDGIDEGANGKPLRC